MPSDPEILTTTVGSYTIPDWLAALPSERARQDATRFVFGLQGEAGRPVLTCMVQAMP